MTSTPLVSVVMPVYNARRYLAAAIESVRRQTMSDFELILVDDGSTDGSGEIMDAAAFGDARLRVIRRTNTGLVGALNDGLAAVRGQFIARMDADDLCRSDRLARQLHHLGKNPRCVAVGAAVDLIDPAGRRLKTMRAPHDSEAIVQELLAGNGAALVHPVVMFRTAAVAAAGGYSRAFAGYGEDWDLYLRLSTHGSLSNLPEILLRYRMHPHSYNHTRSADHVRDYLAAVNRARGQNSLAPITALPGPRPANRAEVHRLWAEWAIEGAEHRTARSHSLMATIHAPFRRSSWQFLKYAAALAAEHAPHEPAAARPRTEVPAKN